MMDRIKVFLGFSADEMRATNVAEFSLRVSASVAREQLAIHRICRLSLGKMYTRPTRIVDGRLWDDISMAPMSTDHAIARFFIPSLCDYRGWALFTDGDVLFRRSVSDLFALADDRYAVMCVQHPELTETGTKKLGDRQTVYSRKNWSSVMLINCGHPANQLLTPQMVNTLPGRELHAFGWLQASEIGALPREWNYLVGVNDPVADPAIVHYTLGDPSMRGHESDPFAEDWFECARAAGYKFPLAAGV